MWADCYVGCELLMPVGITDEVSDCASRNPLRGELEVHLAPFTRGFARWWLCRAVGELDPGRGVVARLVPAAHVPVDAGGDKASRDRATEKKMIEPQARVAAARFRK